MNDFRRKLVVWDWEGYQNLTSDLNCGPNRPNTVPKLHEGRSGTFQFIWSSFTVHNV